MDIDLLYKRDVETGSTDSRTCALTTTWSICQHASQQNGHILMPNVVSFLKSIKYFFRTCCSHKYKVCICLSMIYLAGFNSVEMCMQRVNSHVFMFSGCCCWSDLQLFFTLARRFWTVLFNNPIISLYIYLSNSISCLLRFIVQHKLVN